MDEPGYHERDVFALPENRAAIAIAALSLLAGVVAVAILGGTAEIITAVVLFGLAGVALIALAFLLVGESEEADRRHRPHG